MINFEMPRSADAYIHRVGRTARAGCGGRSVTLIGEGSLHAVFAAAAAAAAAVAAAAALCHAVFAAAAAAAAAVIVVLLLLLLLL